MNADWKQRPEGGGWVALWMIRAIARSGGRSVARLLLYPITAYFLIVRGPERGASLDYLTRALPRPPGLIDLARHVHTFASTILDRVFLLSGQVQRFQINISGLAEVHTLLDQGKGLLMFGSHLGSFEVMRVLARQRPDIQVRVVLDRAHNAAVTQLLEALNPEIARTVIDAGQDGPSIVLAIKQATAEGALVAMLVDRARPGEPWIAAPLLGAQAPFPVAPWLIAAALKVPVALAFGLYRGGNRYDLAFEVFSQGLTVERHNRRQRLAELVAAYAQRLEHHMRSAPYNWFNFYDFWRTDDPDQIDVRGTGDVAVQRRTAQRRSA